MNVRSIPPLALAFTLFIGCSKSPVSTAELESELSEVQAEVSKTSRALAALRTELKRQQDLCEATKTTNDEMHKSLHAAEKEQKYLAAEFDQYRGDYRASIVKRAPGMSIDDFSAGGKDYNSVKVTALDDWELTIMHSGGSAHVALADLPPKLKSLFAYDPTAGSKPVAARSLPLPDTSNRVSSPPSGSNSGGSDSKGGQATAVNNVGSSLPAPPAKNQSSTSVSGRHLGASGSDRRGNYEVIAKFGTAGGGGGSGSKVTGAKASVPENYKPIGSGFSGSSMDKNKKP